MQSAPLTVHSIRLLLLSLACAMAACSPSQDRAELVVLNGAEPESLDPAIITSQVTGRIANALFEGLAACDASGTPRPGVAESWDVSADGLTYTFHLRKNAKWSNGDPVTSADFMGSWRRTLLPATASEYSYQLHYIKNAKAFNEGTLQDFSQVGLRAPDPWTFEVTLNNPTPYWLDLCAFPTLFPVHIASIEAAERRKQSFIKPGNLVSNGAYELKSWRVHDRMRLEKNPHYWNGANVAMRTIDLLPINKAMTALNFYQTGAADLIIDKGLTPAALIEQLKTRPDFHSAQLLGTYFIRFNNHKKPFDDPRVRLAFSLTIDKPYLCDKITRAGQPPANSFVPPNTAGYTPPPGLARDPERARKLLAEAGFPNGTGFPIVDYLYVSGEDIDASIAVELQATLKRELGVNVQLAQQEKKVYLQSLSDLKYDFARSSWIGDYKDANTFLDMFVTDGGNNQTGWSNKTYDQHIAAAATEIDVQKRFEVFRQAEHILVTEQAPICPLFHFVGIQFYDDTRLGGIESNILDDHPFKTMYWKKR